MKKLLALLLTIVMAVSLASCGGGNSNEDSKKNPIVGKWKMTSSDFSKVKNHNSKCDNPKTIKDDDAIAEFFEDGSCNLVVFICYSVHGLQYMYYNDYSSYETKQNGTLDTNGGDYKYSISNNQLIIYTDDYFKDDFYEIEIPTLTFDRVE